MKYTRNFICIIALVAVAFSCSKETDIQPKESENPAAKESGTEGDKDNTQSDQTLDPSKYLVGFEASFENTKVTIDTSTGDQSFEDNDRVLVRSGSTTKEYKYEEASSTFIPADDAIELAENMEVYYPYGAFSLSGDDMVFTMPGAVESETDLGDKNPLAGKLQNSSGSNYIVNFKTVASILKVGITGDNTLSSVVLSNSNNIPVNTASDFTVIWNEGVPSFTSASTDSSISIAAGNDLDPSSPVYFYFILPAGNSVEGLKVTANLTAPHNGGTDSFSISRETFTPERTKIYSMSFYAGLFSGGEGTEANPYKIANARDFKHIHTYTTDGYESLTPESFLSAHYVQTADIAFGKDADHKADLSAYTIGTASAQFTGNYNGKPESTQYTLSNFSITGYSSGNEGVAIFRAISNATLQYIAIENEEVVGVGETGNKGKFSAGLVGYSSGASVIKNCSLSNVSVSSNVGYGAGGLAGGIYGTTKVTDCQVTNLSLENTSSEAMNYYGGVVCYANGTVYVDNCSLNGTTTITGTINGLGGILGQTNADNVNVRGCTNNSAISGNNYVGGIVGTKTKGKILGCVNHGNVNGKEQVGGIVGHNAAGEISNYNSTYSQNRGVVSGSSNVGGIAGQHTAGNFSSVTNYGKVSGGNNVGGIVGNKNGGNIYSFVHNKADDAVSGTYNVGGIVGLQSGGATHGNLANGANAIVRNEAAVTATGKDGSNVSAVGGIIGRMTGGTLGNTSTDHRAANIGNVTGSGSGSSVGGLVGYMTGGTIRHCRSNATVINNSGFVGGAIGYMTSGTVEGCYAKGNAKASGNVGGFVGIINNPAAPVYILNCAAGVNVINTRSGQNDGAGGFIGYLKASSADKTANISNCVVWDVIIKAISETGAGSNKIRVGGFAGVVNGSYNPIQNCYYRGVSKQLGYGGTDDWNSEPTKNVGASGTMIGGFTPYAAGTFNDCYSIPTFKISGSTSGSNYIQLTEQYIKGRVLIVQKDITTSDGYVINAGAEKTLGDVLTLVASGNGESRKQLGGIDLSDWNYYTVNGDYYFYPDALTALGEDFYKK